MQFISSVPPRRQKAKMQFYLVGPYQIRWHLVRRLLSQKAKMPFYLVADAILSGPSMPSYLVRDPFLFMKSSQGRNSYGFLIHWRSQTPPAKRRKCNFIWSGPDAILSGPSSVTTAGKAKMPFIWSGPDAILSGRSDAIYVYRYCIILCT